VTPRLLPRSLAVLALAAFAALAVLGGCSKRETITIESDTCWNGVVNADAGITGCGNASYTVKGRLDCVQVTRTTSNGFVRIRIDGRPWAETTSSVPTLKVCN